MVHFPTAAAHSLQPSAHIQTQCRKLGAGNGGGVGARHPSLQLQNPPGNCSLQNRLSHPIGDVFYLRRDLLFLLGHLTSLKLLLPTKSPVSLWGAWLVLRPLNWTCWVLSSPFTGQARAVEGVVVWMAGVPGETALIPSSLGPQASRPPVLKPNLREIGRKERFL